MRLLVDENIPILITDWLIHEGHDILIASEHGAGEQDEHWLEMAERDQRIIVTSDKDYGELIYRDKLNSHGIILLRFYDLSLDERLMRLQTTWSVVEANPTGCFIVVTTNRVRVRRIS